MRRAKGGRLWAGAWYWHQVTAFPVRLLLDRIAGGHALPASANRLTGGMLVGSTIQDIRYAGRGFIRTPGFTLVAVMTLALGVGATTSIFSVVNGIVLRPLPYPESDRLMAVFSTDLDGARDNHSGANFLDFKTQSRSFQEIAGHRALRLTVETGDAPQLVRGNSVTPNFFSVLDVPAALGRTLSPEVDVPGSNRTVVLSHRLWQSQFGGDISILGRQVRMNEEQYAVVGVMPPEFDFPEDSEFWAASRYRVPESPVELIDPEQARNVSWLSAIGRLKQGVNLTQAQTEMSTTAERLADEYPDVNGDEDLLLVPLRESIVGQVSTTLYVLLGAVGFLLLIACANVANLLLVRASGREREMAVRAALGAGRVRIVRQLATESVVLAVSGGVIGFVLAHWGTRALLALAPNGVPRVAEVGTDIRVLGFTLATALGTGVLFGLAPAIQSFGRSTARSAAVGGTRQTASRSRNRLRNALIVAEVAVSLVLLVGAGLTARTLLSLTRVDPGFRADRTLSARVWIPGNKYQEDDQIQSFYRETLERVRAIPGVQSAGAVFSLPVNAGINGTFTFSIEGRPVEEGEEGLLAEYQIATADYFRTIGIPLLRGRSFSDGDDSEAPGVAIVNEALADTYWRNEDPIGKRITWGDPEGEETDWATIVGVVGNTRNRGLDQPATPEIYRPYLQVSLPYMTLLVRSQLEVATLTSAVRQAVMAVDPGQPISAVATLENVLFDSLGSRRFNMLLLGVFAIAALVLAAIGLYGVLSYSVTQRSNEIGIRMALGARAGGVVSRVIREGIGLALIGLVIGTAGALALTRFMSSMIHGIGTTDPVTFVAGTLMLVAIAGLASFVPALRASRVDPMKVLRSD
jgi:putative ABC transport system permease protein